MNLKIDFKIIIFALFFCLTGQIKYYLIIMLFATIHEMAHLLTGIIMGFKVKKIELMPVGLSLLFKEDINSYNKKILKGNVLSLKKIIVLFAGPLINIIIAIFFLKFKINIKFISNEEIIYSNLLIAFFNLLPIYPLDGGRIIKRIMYIFLGLKKSLQYTLIISNIVAVCLNFILINAIYVTKNIAFLLIIFYLTMILIIENKNMKIKIKMYSILEKNIAIN